MKRLIIILLVSLSGYCSFGQNKAEADKLVDEGVALTDKGDYAGAISIYDKALQLDKDNLVALAEKAYTLLSMNKYDEAIEYCKRVIAIHPKDLQLRTVYVTYGNALDGLHKTDEALERYDEGIKLFPDYYQLYFNKGITLSSVKKIDESLLCFEHSALLNPAHASSQNAIGRLQYTQQRNIPALMAFCRFLIIEPKGKRAVENLAFLQKIMKANVKQTTDKSITITLDPKSLDDKSKKGKARENNFGTTEMILSLTAAQDFDKENANKTEVEKFIRKFSSICASFKEGKKDNSGFYWNYYVPYFISLDDNKFIETFAYIVFASSDQPEIAAWLNEHKSAVDKFYDWNKTFNWDTK